MSRFSNVLHLFSLGDPAAGNDDNLVFFVKRYNLCNTVRGTGMVDVAGKEKKKSQFKKKQQVLDSRAYNEATNNKSTLTELGHLLEWHQSPAHC